MITFDIVRRSILCFSVLTWRLLVFLKIIDCFYLMQIFDTQNSHTVVNFNQIHYTFYRFYGTYKKYFTVNTGTQKLQNVRTLILWKFTLQFAPALVGMNLSPSLLGEDNGDPLGVLWCRLCDNF